MKEEITYLWRCQQFGKWFTTRFQATEEHIRKEHPEAVAVAGTRRVQMIPETPEEQREQSRANSTGGFLRGHSPTD